jgi:putative membrane protein
MELHRALIRIALGLSVVFLLLYVAYHMTSDSTLYGDSNGSGSLDILEKAKIGAMAYFYYTLLISHILLSIAVIPLVLFTYLFAWQGDFVKHKKWTRFSFPIWLYVAVSGVVVYFMISPYYV